MTEDQVSSGEFADLRPNPKVYLDSNIVSAIAKDDIPTESQALNRLLQAWDDKKVDLVTSEVTLWEISAHQDELKRRLVERTCRRLAKAQIIRWYELAGMYSYGDRHTWISTPIIQNDPAYEALLAFGLEVVDAQQVFVAVKQKCNIFLTCDRGVRDRAAAIKDQFALIVQKPSEFVARQGR
jgi:predicted nucleic acid-binding protein